MITVHVTQADIDAGVPSNSCGCPVALAVQRVCKPRVRVATGSMTVGQAFFVLPDVAFRFVADFDAGRPVAPFTFEVQLGDER